MPITKKKKKNKKANENKIVWRENFCVKKDKNMVIKIIWII